MRNLEQRRSAAHQTMDEARHLTEAFLLRREGLSFDPDDAARHFTSEQAQRAACYARRDAATLLLMQKVQLDRLNVVYRLAWAAVALLAFIAIRVA